MARLSWAAELAPAMARAVASSKRLDDVETSATEECLECSCGFTCGTPTAMQKHRGRCSLDARSLPATPHHREESSEPMMSRSLTTTPGETKRAQLRHASSSVQSYKTQLRRQGSDGTLYCPCGFTCGTAMAWEKHQLRCELQNELPNQPSAPASAPRRPKAMTDPLGSVGPEQPAPALPPAPAKNNGPAKRKTLRLLLVRHGESANRTTSNKCPDPGLSEKGHRQAAALAERLREFEKEAAAGHLRILCSPMLRCLETIRPALELLPALPHGSCICHGACYEHGCAGRSFPGTAADEIVERFPQFLATGFTPESTWDYRGKSDKESSEECAIRAKSVVHMLRQSMEELWQSSNGSSPVLILVGHQTLGDLLCHLLLEGDCKEWQYGTPKYKFKNASISELHVNPNGQVTSKDISSDYHVLGIR